MFSATNEKYRLQTVSAMERSIFECSYYLLFCLIMPLLIQNRSWCGPNLVLAEQLQIVEEFTDDENPVCNNVDVRNNLKYLYKIENCTVITGFLQLVLIEKTSKQEFEKYQFPKLRYTEFRVLDQCGERFACISINY